MLKQLLHKTFSISLAIIVLFSTVSFTIEKHYCGDVLVDVSVFSEAEKCGMEALEILQKKSCCKDEIDVIKGQDELKVSFFEELDFEQQQFITAFVYSYINGFESLPKQTIPHKDYSPPNLVADIQVLDQVFLI
ncbi:hypothetical protein [uncultured Algibacter sp.]|uniref:HYC_CC_PP family protein n=1 Tax=uncultured Algibacter sp. TaxID=298659 RepID=UPI00261E11D1|nr:hypothetical protein [uncultured Algibacter sp.]